MSRENAAPEKPDSTEEPLTPGSQGLPTPRRIVQ